MLKIRNLNKFYSDGIKKLHVLNDVNLDIEKNEFVSVKGPSGAGKTTLLNVIGGLDKPNEGSVCCNSQSIYEMKDKNLADLRNEIFGFVFQFYHLLPEFTVLENVILPGFISGKYKKRKLIKKAQGLLESVNMNHRIDYRPNQLSGGEQQRVALVRALILDPEILLCDEPTGNLDSKNTQRICDLLIDLHNKTKQTIIIVTHQEDVASIAKRKLFIKDGSLVKN